MKNLIVAFVFVLLLGTLSGCKEQAASALPPPEVQVVEVIQQDILLKEDFVGQTYGLFDIAIQARVDGFLEEMHFEEGRRVKKGQLLYTIDPQPFQAKLAGAMSQLAEANTMLAKAESDLSRIEPLAEMNAVSQSDLVAASAERDAALSSVKAAESAVEFSRIELGYTRIYSPINGTIGKTQAYPGDYVGRGIGDVVLNDVSRTDTILVEFHISEEKYLDIVRPFLEGDKVPRVQRNDDRQGLTMTLADGSVYPIKGRIRFVNRQVNSSTGTILLQAAFANPNRFLKPGQFAKVEAVIDVVKGGMLIPQRCAQELQGNYSVFMVNDQDEIEFRQIEVEGTYQTSFLVVNDGLSPGDRVVYEGLQMVKGGSKVKPVLKDISIPESEN